MNRLDVRQDPVEAIVADALDIAGIQYHRNGPLDFECGHFAIECKAAYSERAIRQLKGRRSVILIQGLSAAQQFYSMVKKSNGGSGYKSPSLERAQAIIDRGRE